MKPYVKSMSPPRRAMFRGVGGFGPALGRTIGPGAGDSHIRTQPSDVVGPFLEAGTNERKN